MSEFENIYDLEFTNHWEKHFQKLPPLIQKRFLKHVEKYKTFPSFDFRHEHHVGLFVDEINQYRICFACDETLKVRKFYFIGDHKDYEKFLKKEKTSSLE